MDDKKTCNTSGAFDCKENHCKNGGTCVSNKNATVLPKCFCPPAFTGDKCEYRSESHGGVSDSNTDDGSAVAITNPEPENIGTTIGIAVGVVVAILVLSLLVGYLIYRKIRGHTHKQMAFGNPVYKPTTESNTSLDADRGVRFDISRANKFDKVHFVRSPHGRSEALLNPYGNDIDC